MVMAVGNEVFVGSVLYIDQLRSITHAQRTFDIGKHRFRSFHLGHKRDSRNLARALKYHCFEEFLADPLHSRTESRICSCKSFVEVGTILRALSKICLFCYQHH